MNIYKIQRHTNIIFKYSGTLTPHGMGADFPMLFYKCIIQQLSKDSNILSTIIPVRFGLF